jgi:putative inorganic carbon (HCO3(-)) transporter
MKVASGGWLKWVLLVLFCIGWMVLLEFALAQEDRLLLLFLCLAGPAFLLGGLLLVDPDTFLYAIIFLVPLSVGFTLPGGYSISLPAEAMIVLLVLFSVMHLDHLKIPDRRIFSHPLFLLLLVQAGWMAICSAFSEIPLVSFKRTLTQVLFVFVFFFLFLTRFTSPGAILRFYALYALGLVVPIIHGFLWHSQYSFSQQSSYYMPQPFYIEHTIYGAALAFVIPVLFYLAIFPSGYVRSRFLRILFASLLILCLLAEFLAYSRAAWMSLLTIPFLLIVFRLRIRIAYLLGASALLLGLAATHPEEVMNFLSRNEARSNRGTVTEQLASVSNIQTDISNLERINRWKCALRMFRDRPVTGFGPGTYQFVYGGFQLKNEMTRISTYHGEKGNAHSEYLGFLSETGLPGLLIYLALILVTLWYATRIIYGTQDRQLRSLTITIALCLLPFWIHTFFNGFLETDEIASLYYGSLAAVVALDLYFYRPLHPAVP